MHEPFFALIDLEPIQREGLLSFLRTGGFQNCVSLNALTDLRDETLAESKQIVILLDCAKTFMASPTVLDRVHEQFPNAYVVLLTNRLSGSATLNALRSGADCLLLNQVSGDVLIKSIELVLMGEKVFPVKALLSLLERGCDMLQNDDEARSELDSLSSRELEVLLRLTAGHPNKIIARHCGITESTVKVHVKAILRKIHVKNRTQAAVWARRTGVTPEMILRQSPNSTLPLPNAIRQDLFENEDTQSLVRMRPGILRESTSRL